MNFKKLSLAAILSGGFVLTGCPTDDTPGGTGDTDDTDPTTMTATMTAGTMTAGTMTAGTMTATTGPSTTDPDTTATDTDPDTDDTESDTTGPDPDVYDFREDAADAYTRVDRMGFPAVATALIATANKDAYNAANPTDDVMGTFQVDVEGTIDFLHVGSDPQDSTGLRDDLGAALGVLMPDPAPTFCRIDSDPGANEECIRQVNPAIYPDVLRIDTDAPDPLAGGRVLEAPMIDFTLSVLLLNLSDGFDFLPFFADLGVDGLSQGQNDVAFPGAFPYLAPAHEAK